jgi:hypothetical protein
MSRKHRNECSYDEKGFSNCCCSLPTLVILILIILQFNRDGNGLFGLNTTGGTGSFNGSFETVDNGILFIIALFYLSCCNPCKR